MARFAAIDAEFAPLTGAEWAAGPVLPPAAHLPEPGRPDDGVPAMPPGVTYVGPLPRQTGTLRPDHLGRDHLGPVLIAGDQRPDGGGG